MGKQQVKVLLYCVALCCVFLPVTLPAQQASIFGQWTAQYLSASLSLNQDGTFAFSGPNGMNSGRWGVQGNTLWMSDAYGQAYYYQIRALTESALLLLDGTGNPINYTRGGATPAQASQKMSDEAKKRLGGKTLITSKGNALTEGMVNTGIEFIEFVAGRSIKDVEKKGYRSASKMEFQKGPENYIKDVEALASAMVKVRALTNPVQIGAVRQAFISAFHKATKTMKEHEKPAAIRIINRYVPVVAFSDQTNLALTKRDLQSALDYLEFCNKNYCEVYNVKSPVTTAQRSWVEKQMTTTFPQMAQQQQQFLVSASLIWSVMQSQWNQMNAAQKNQMKPKMASLFPSKEVLARQAAQATASQTPNQGWKQPVDGSTSASPYSAGANSQGSGNQSSGGKKSLAQMQREFNANQACFNMMNNMSLGTHATMLNTIENFGNTGNYWKVVDY